MTSSYTLAPLNKHNVDKNTNFCSNTTKRNIIEYVIFLLLDFSYFKNRGRRVCGGGLG